MDNKTFYTAIKNTIDYYRTQEKSHDGFYLIKDAFANLEEKDFEEYHEDFDYRKIFLRSYYRRYFDTSPSFDYEGKEIHWKQRMVAEILFNHLLRQLDDKEQAYPYKVGGDISVARYEELLAKHGLM